MKVNLTKSDTMRKRLTGKKKRMVEALRKNLIVSSACEEVRVSRQTHYEWLKTDLLYSGEVNLVWEELIDFVEGKLFEKIKSGDLKAITFFLNARAKSRGYGEKQIVEISNPIKQAEDDPEVIKAIHELPDEIREKLMSLY